MATFLIIFFIFGLSVDWASSAGMPSNIRCLSDRAFCQPLAYRDDVIEMLTKRITRDHAIANHNGMGCREQYICSIPYCQSGPCLNGGTCVELLEGFICDCPHFASGPKCEDIDECASDPCLNNGTCIDKVNGFQCLCIRGLTGNMCEARLPFDCEEIFVAGNTASGVYSIYIHGNNSLSTPVFCDMDTPGGGWLVIHRREKQTKLDFYRNWANYSEGFGNVSGEFWLGNDHLYALTSQRDYALRIDYENLDGTRTYATYSMFSVRDGISKYMLSLGGLGGNETRDYMSPFSWNRFSTYDNDNDICVKLCAEIKRGGWWYTHCHGLGYFNEGNYWVDLVQHAELKIHPTN